MSRAARHEPTHNVRLLRELREIRKAAGVKNFTLAMDADVPEANICGYEQARHIPTIVTFEKLINALGHELKIVKRQA